MCMQVLGGLSDVTNVCHLWVQRELYAPCQVCSTLTLCSLAMTSSSFLAVAVSSAKWISSLRLSTFSACTAKMLEMKICAISICLCSSKKLTAMKRQSWNHEVKNLPICSVCQNKARCPTSNAYRQASLVQCPHS